MPTRVFAVGRECCAVPLRVNFRFQDGQQPEAGVGVELSFLTEGRRVRPCLRSGDSECLNKASEDVAVNESLDDPLDVPNEIFDIHVRRRSLQEQFIVLNAHKGHSSF